MKKLLLFGAVAMMSVAANAQDHALVYKLSAEAATAFSQGDQATGLHDERMVVWFDTDFKHVSLDNPAASTIWDKDVEMINSSERIVKYKDVLHGSQLIPEAVGDMIFVTVPSKTMYPVELDVTSGTVLFHIVLGGKPNRINDVDNTWGAYLDDCNGMNVAIAAPAGAQVMSYLGSPAYDTKDGAGKITRVAFFKYPNATAGGFEQMSSDKPYNDLTVLTPTGTAWTRGYCCKYIDVAISGVKPGDRVGLRGIQTLYPGYTPEKMEGSSAVAEIGATPAAPEYYNLQGVKLQSAPQQGLYMVREGNKVTKVVK